MLPEIRSRSPDIYSLSVSGTLFISDCSIVMVFDHFVGSFSRNRELPDNARALNGDPISILVSVIRSF